jgi:hypothetical protein
VSGLDLTAAIEAVARELAIDQDHSRHCATLDAEDADCDCLVIGQTRCDADIALTIALPLLADQLLKHIEPLDRTAFRDGAEWAAALMRGSTTGGGS